MLLPSKKNISLKCVKINSDGLCAVDYRHLLVAAVRNGQLSAIPPKIKHQSNELIIASISDWVAGAPTWAEYVEITDTRAATVYDLSDKAPLTVTVWVTPAETNDVPFGFEARAVSGEESGHHNFNGKLELWVSETAYQFNNMYWVEVEFVNGWAQHFFIVQTVGNPTNARTYDFQQEYVIGEKSIYVDQGYTELAVLAFR